MSDKGSVSAKGGNGLLTAGIVIAVLIGAGIYLTYRDDRYWDAAQVEAVVPQGDQTVILSGGDVPQAAPASKDPVAPEAIVAAPLSITENNASEDVAEAPVTTEDTAAPPTAADNAAPPPPQETEENVAEVATAPSVDEIRVDEGGVMIVAGRAAPGSRVDVLIDGEVVSSADADASGAFAALGTVAANDAAQTLTLRAEEGAVSTPSTEEIILAPVRQATPAPDQTSDTEQQVETAALAAEPEASVALAESPLAEATPAPADTPVPVAPQPQTAQQDQTPADPPDGVVEQTAPLADQTAVALSPAATDAGTAPGVSVATSPAAPLAPAETTQTASAPTPSNAPDVAGRGLDIAVLRSDTSGVSLIQTPPLTTARVVLDTIGYGADGVVQLAGRAGGNAAEVRVYLDNSAVAMLPVVGDGRWQGEVPGVVPGVYRLRIDALSLTGSVISRIETPFKREAPAALVAATEAQDGPVQAVTVQTGDTLWAIARDRYGEGVLYVQVFEANRDAIRDPDLIYPGQVFDLPGD